MKNKTRPAPGNRLLQLALSSLAGYAFTCSPQALGAVTNVSIVNFAFSPANVTIRVNDSVTWRWVGSPHSTTSDPGLWESGVLGAGSTFTRTFTSPGNFPYHCSVHPFMTGAIAVQAANVSPTVALTNPADGSVFAAPATIALRATASDSDGTVTNVQFLEGTIALADVGKMPFSATVNNLAAGDYTFSAVATDNSGSKATNSATVLVVTAVPILLSSPQQLSPTGFRFTYSANAGLSYVVQRSPDLTHWILITTNKATSNTQIVLDQNPVGNPGFYRVGLLPNT